MRGHLWKLLLTSLFLLALAGCSVEPGGSEDPPGYSAELTPASPAAPLVTSEAVPTEAAAPGRLETLEGSLTDALVRIQALEQSMKELKDSVGAIEMTASEALLKSQEGPFARVDLSDDTAVGKALMEQSLEQIIGISKLLLDKMENKVLENGAEGAAPDAQEEPASEVQ